MDVDSIIKIMEKEENKEGNTFAWGLRRTQKQEETIPGAELANSYHWEDGETTEKEIDGTCVITLPESDDVTDATLQRAIKLAQAYSGQLILVRGQVNIDEPTNDIGESILKDAVCVCAL